MSNSLLNISMWKRAANGAVRDAIVRNSSLGIRMLDQAVLDTVSGIAPEELDEW